MSKRSVFLAAFAIALVARLCHGQKVLKPDNIGAYKGIYVEGTLQLSKVDQNEACAGSWYKLIPETKKDSWHKLKPKTETKKLDKDGWPRQPVAGRLLVPTQGAADKEGNGLSFCVSTGGDQWRAASIPFDQITSLTYGFVPQGPVLSTTDAAIIGTAVTGSTAIVATTNAINKTWKVSLGATGIGIAAAMAFKALYNAGVPVPRTKRKSWYYLVVGFNTDPWEVFNQGDEAKKWDYSKTYYPSKGSFAVFAMETESFWPTVLFLQSGTGLPLGSLPVPGQSAKGGQ